MKKQKGFTLIELLVVIAIIGILSAVVLASLNTARNKGNDAAIQSDLSNLRTQAEMYYSGAGGNSYGSQAWSSGAATSCIGGMFSDANVTKMLIKADSVNGPGTVDCYAGGTGYLVGVALTASTTSAWWCIDHTGNGKMEIGILPTTAPANNTCP